MTETVLVRYGEIALKGRNRRRFEDQLVKNILGSLSGLPHGEVVARFGRIFVEPGEDPEPVVRRLRRVFGVVSASPALCVPPALEPILAGSQEAMARQLGSGEAGSEGAGTFKVSARRADKRFPVDSMDLNRIVGAHLLRQFPALSVDVHLPRIVLSVEVREEAAYLFTSTHPGPGGLPVGVSGRGVVLLSGGLDSPVASWYAMRRGMELVAAHFYSFPFTTERSKQKVLDLCRVLGDYSRPFPFKLYVVPFTRIQEAILGGGPPELGVTLMRRMMVRIATDIAGRERALALVTGESLGQVASQTLESIAVIEEAVGLPILRPLIGFDKQEIVRKAREIGTYEISILPYQDCCSLFVPKHPETRPDLSQVERAEGSIDVQGLVAHALDGAEVPTIGSP